MGYFSNLHQSIIELHEDGVSLDEIAIRLKVDLGSVAEVVKDYEDLADKEILEILDFKAKDESCILLAESKKIYVGYEEDNYDDSMDGDHDSAMASAGFGTDEDYGYYGDE